MAGRKHMAPYVKYTKLETKFLVARVIHSDFSIIILPMLDYSCELHVIEVAFGIYWSPMQHIIDFLIGKPVMWTKEKFNNATNCENKHRDLQNVEKNVRHLGVKKHSLWLHWCLKEHETFISEIEFWRDMLMKLLTGLDKRNCTFHCRYVNYIRVRLEDHILW